MGWRAAGKEEVADASIHEEDEVAEGRRHSLRRHAPQPKSERKTPGTGKPWNPTPTPTPASTPKIDRSNSRQNLKHESQEAGEHGFRGKVELANHIEARGKGWVSRPKANRIIYHKKGLKVPEVLRRRFRGIAFREVSVLDRSCWVYSLVLEVNKLGKVRVGSPLLQPEDPHRHLL